MADSLLEDDRPVLDVTLTDRRSPEQAGDENAHLIALLRGQPLVADKATPEVDGVPEVLAADDLALTRGILIGLPIAAAMWTAIVFAIWHFI